MRPTRLCGLWTAECSGFPKFLRALRLGNVLATHSFPMAARYAQKERQTASWLYTQTRYLYQIYRYRRGTTHCCPYHSRAKGSQRLPVVEADGQRSQFVGQGRNVAGPVYEQCVCSRLNQLRNHTHTRKNGTSNSIIVVTAGPTTFFVAQDVVTGQGCVCRIVAGSQLIHRPRTILYCVLTLTVHFRTRVFFFNCCPRPSVTNL